MSDVVPEYGRAPRKPWFTRIPRPLWMSVLLVGLIAFTFEGTFRNLFVYWDDNVSIVENPDFNPPTVKTLAKFWNDPAHGYHGFYVPIPYTIWWVAAHIDRLPSGNGPSLMPNERVFHALNLTFHAGGAVLAFFLLRKLTGTDLPALVGAVLFALHPIQADPVCWASSMYTPLSGLFSLSAWLLYIRFSDGKAAIPTTRRRTGRAALYSAAILFYVLALLTKATIILLPVTIAVVELAIRKRRLKDCQALVPWLVLALGAGLLTHHTQLAKEVYVPPIWLRPLVATDALAFYLFKLFLPIGLAPDYARSPKWALSHGVIAFTWIVPALVAIASWKFRRRVPWLWVSAAVFAAGLLPTLGLIPYDYQFYSTVADRYAYFAMLGPAMALAFLLRNVTVRRKAHGRADEHAEARPRPPRVGALISAELACLLLALLCRRQVGYWADTRVLFRRTLAVNPNSMIAHRQLGYIMLLADLPEEADEAIEHYQASLKLVPVDPGALSNLGMLLTRQHRAAEAVEAFRAATLLCPGQGPMHYNMGNAMVMDGKYNDAVIAFGRAIELSPNFFDANMQVADALAASGQKEAAKAHYRGALRVRPKWGPALAGLNKLAPPAGPLGPPKPENARIE